MGQVVYAFDQIGDVYKTTDGGDGTLTGSFTLSVDTIRWSPNPCGDTIGFYAIGANCIPFSVDSVSILAGTEFLRLPNDGSLPQNLTAGDSAQILLLYSPTTGGNTTSQIRVYGHDTEHTVTHDVIINAYNSLPNNMIVSKDTCMLNAQACGDAIDSVYLANLGCSGNDFRFRCITEWRNFCFHFASHSGSG